MKQQISGSESIEQRNKLVSNLFKKYEPRLSNFTQRYITKHYFTYVNHFLTDNYHYLFWNSLVDTIERFDKNQNNYNFEQLLFVIVKRSINKTVLKEHMHLYNSAKIKVKNMAENNVYEFENKYFNELEKQQKLAKLNKFLVNQSCFTQKVINSKISGCGNAEIAQKLNTTPIKVYTAYWKFVKRFQVVNGIKGKEKKN